MFLDFRVTTSQSRSFQLFPRERERWPDLMGNILQPFLCICFLVKEAVPPSLGPRSVYNLSREMRLKVSRASFKHSAVSHFRASHLQFIQKWFASFLFVCIWGRKLLWDVVAFETLWRQVTAPIYIYNAFQMPNGILESECAEVSPRSLTTVEVQLLVSTLAENHEGQREEYGRMQPRRNGTSSHLHTPPCQ